MPAGHARGRRLIDTGEVKNAAALARRYGVTRARVSQFLSLVSIFPPDKTSVSSLGGCWKHDVGAL